MPTIFIRMVLKVFGGKSPIFFYNHLLQSFRFGFWFLSFFLFQTDYSLILYYKAKS